MKFNQKGGTMIKITEWTMFPAKNRPFKIDLAFQGWHCIQLGIHIDFKMLNIELHFPFGFVRIGKVSNYSNVNLKNG